MRATSLALLSLLCPASALAGACSLDDVLAATQELQAAVGVNAPSETIATIQQRIAENQEKLAQAEKNRQASPLDKLDLKEKISEDQARMSRLNQATDREAGARVIAENVARTPTVSVDSKISYQAPIQYTPEQFKKLTEDGKSVIDLMLHGFERGEVVYFKTGESYRIGTIVSEKDVDTLLLETHDPATGAVQEISVPKDSIAVTSKEKTPNDLSEKDWLKEVTREIMKNPNRDAIEAKLKELDALKKELGPDPLVQLNDARYGKLVREIDELRYQYAPFTDYERRMFGALDEIDPKTTELTPGEEAYLRRLDKLVERKRHVSEADQRWINKLKAVEKIPEANRAKRSAQAGAKLYRLNGSSFGLYKVPSKIESSLPKAFPGFTGRQDQDQLVKLLESNPTDLDTRDPLWEFARRFLRDHDSKATTQDSATRDYILERLRLYMEIHLYQEP